MLDLIQEYYHLMVRGVAYTLLIAASGFAIGFAISMVLTIARFLGPWPVRAVANGYINFFRGTPLLVQILIIYFGLPSVGVKLDALESAILAIGLNSGAYQAEILRVAIKSIPEEQVMVARSLGLSEVQIMSHIILPVAVRASLPGLTNEAVVLLKESSLASVIGVMELTRVGEYMVSATFRALEALTIVALVYLLLSTIVFRLFKSAERRHAIPGFERWV